MKKTMAAMLGIAGTMWAQDSAAQREKLAVAMQNLQLAEAQAAQNTDAARVAKTKAELDSLKTFVFVTGQMYNGNPVKNAPYSAEAVTETTQTLADGNHIKTSSSTLQYRDSDGRERREETIGKLGDWNAQGEAPKVVFISDPVAKMSYTLHPSEKTAEQNKGSGGAHTLVMNSNSYAFSSSSSGNANTEVHLGVGEGKGAGIGYSISTDDGLQTVRAQKKMTAANTKTEDLGTQVFDGVVAEGTRTTTTIPAGQLGNERDINIVSERWYSKELQMVVKTVHSDPRTGETVYQLKNINRTEPQRSLFEIPADYKINNTTLEIRKPSKEF